MEFYSQRLAGDIQSRAVLNASIAGTLVNTFAPLMLNTAMMVFYLVLMLRQSPLLTMIGLDRAASEYCRVQPDLQKAYEYRPGADTGRGQA